MLDSRSFDFACTFVVAILATETEISFASRSSSGAVGKLSLVIDIALLLVLLLLLLWRNGAKNPAAAM